MNSGNRSEPIFALERRQEVFYLLKHHFKEDSRIVGLILVGSGAYGFLDEYSGIDLPNSFSPSFI